MVFMAGNGEKGAQAVRLLEKQVSICLVSRSLLRSVLWQTSYSLTSLWPSETGCIKDASVFQLHHKAPSLTSFHTSKDRSSHSAYQRLKIDKSSLCRSTHGPWGKNWLNGVIFIVHITGDNCNVYYFQYLILRYRSSVWCWHINRSMFTLKSMWLYLKVLSL